MNLPRLRQVCFSKNSIENWFSFVFPFVFRFLNNSIIGKVFVALLQQMHLLARTMFHEMSKQLGIGFLV